MPQEENSEDKEELDGIIQKFSQAKFVWQSNKNNISSQEKHQAVENRIRELDKNFADFSQLTRDNPNRNQSQATLKKKVEVLSKDLHHLALSVWKQAELTKLLQNFRDKKHAFVKMRTYCDDEVQAVIDQRIRHIETIENKLINADIALSDWKVSFGKTKKVIDIFMKDFMAMQGYNTEKKNTPIELWKGVDPSDMMQILENSKQAFEAALNQVFPKEPVGSKLVFSKVGSSPNTSRTSSSEDVTPTQTPRKKT